MCGVVGIIETENSVFNKVIGVLNHLEYRGYDAAGIALLNNSNFFIQKVVGSVKELENICNIEMEKSDISGIRDSFIGMGHTRWATHGVNSIQNTHPIVVGDVSIAHNGTIENYFEIRKSLEQAGFEFKTDTDTEVIAVLLDDNIKRYGDIFKAICVTVDLLNGIFNCVFLYKKNSNAIYCIQNGISLVFGLSKTALYVSSDSVGLAPYVDRVGYIEDKSVLVLSSHGTSLEYQIKSFDGTEKEIIFRNSDDCTSFSKNEYPNYMIKEIKEQESCLLDLWLKYYSSSGFIRNKPLDNGLRNIMLSERLSDFDSFCIIGCGSAFHAGMIGKYMIENIFRKKTDVEIASEFNSRLPILDKKTLYIFVSQSGETADTMIALQYVKRHSMKTLGITNLPNSSLARMVDYTLFTEMGYEISVASTKCFTAQLVAFLLLIFKMNDLNLNGPISVDSVPDSSDSSDRMEFMIKLPETHDEFLKQFINIKGMVSKYDRECLQIAKDICGSKKVMYVARGMLYPMALEGALKIKELAYISSEGYASGELKHGSISLVDKDTAIVVIVQRDHLLKKVLLCLEEVHARCGKIYLITHEDILKDFSRLCVKGITIPEVSPLLMPILSAIPLQLIAYHAATLLGNNVDRPRNLAKSVTVE